MSEPGSSQHQGTVAIGKTANDPAPATDLPHQTFQGIVGPYVAAMLNRKVVIGQGLINALTDLLSCLGELQGVQFVSDGGTQATLDEANDWITLTMRLFLK